MRYLEDENIIERKNNCSEKATYITLNVFLKLIFIGLVKICFYVFHTGRAVMADHSHPDGPDRGYHFCCYHMLIRSSK